MPTILELANLAEDVYSNAPTAPAGWWRANCRAPLGGITGFFGAAYRQENDVVVVAFRGSQGPGDDFIRDWGINDLAIASKSLPVVQVVEAELFARHVRQIFPNTKFFYITGHSLGGALAQIVAGNMDGSVGVTFNAPGVLDHSYSMIRSWDNAASVLNFRVDGDLVSAFGKHVGKAPITMGHAGCVGLWARTVKTYQAHGGGLMLLAAPAQFGTAVMGGWAIDHGKTAAAAHKMGGVFSALRTSPQISNNSPEALLL